MCHLTCMDPLGMDHREPIRSRALALGFDAVGFAAAEAEGDAGARLREFVAGGLHGDMGWLATTLEATGAPRTLWPAARSVIVLGLNYGPAGDPLAVLGARREGAISVYALGRDYHDVVKTKLKALARWIAESFAAEVKVFVDTAPVMEKPLAAAAGVGWQGKHTNLVSRDLGSWLFLGEVFTTLALAPDAPEADHCGACRRCLDICPTAAFPGALSLDARRCISYLTIEHKGHIAREFRPRSATASTAATTASRSARGTSSRKWRASRRCSRARPWRGRCLPSLRGWTTRRSAAVLRFGGQAPRPRPLRAQRADRDRQQRRSGAGRRPRAPGSTTLAPGARDGDPGRCRGCSRRRSSAALPRRGASPTPRCARSGPVAQLSAEASGGGYRRRRSWRARRGAAHRRSR
jgi:epoxyqueuosine reductase QueG